jgi:hypothetical protein
MTRHTYAALVFFVGFFSLAESAVAQSIADKTWWHTRLTQAQRNDNIVRVAQSFPNGFNAGVSCKVWVQTMVVPQASKNVAKIPLNNSYCDWMWQWGPDVEAVATDRWDGVEWWPGMIIQCQVRTTSGGLSPHTMIVISSDRWGAGFIECNWKNDGVVRRRYADWVTLRQQMVHYTLYRVK